MCIKTQHTAIQATIIHHTKQQREYAINQSIQSLLSLIAFTVYKTELFSIPYSCDIKHISLKIQISAYFIIRHTSLSNASLLFCTFSHWNFEGILSCTTLCVKGILQSPSGNWKFIVDWWGLFGIVIEQSNSCYEESNTEAVCDAGSLLTCIQALPHMRTRTYVYIHTHTEMPPLSLSLTHTHSPQTYAFHCT